MVDVAETLRRLEVLADVDLAWDQPVAGVQFNRVTVSSDEGKTVWWVRSRALHFLDLEEGFETELPVLAERARSEPVEILEVVTSADQAGGVSTIRGCLGILLALAGSVMGFWSLYSFVWAAATTGRLMGPLVLMFLALTMVIGGVALAVIPGKPLGNKPDASPDKERFPETSDGLERPESGRSATENPAS